MKRIIEVTHHKIDNVLLTKDILLGHNVILLGEQSVFLTDIITRISSDSFWTKDGQNYSIKKIIPYFSENYGDYLNRYNSRLRCLEPLFSGDILDSIDKKLSISTEHYEQERYL